MSWLWLAGTDTAFSETPVVFREGGRDIETLPLNQAFHRAANSLELDPLVPRHAAAGFKPRFVDAVDSNPPYIVLGLVRSNGREQVNATIVQTNEYTNAPVDKAPMFDLDLEGVQAWTPPSLPVVLDGRSYYQYIARTPERQLILSIEATEEPAKADVKNLVASMLRP